MLPDLLVHKRTEALYLDTSSHRACRAESDHEHLSEDGPGRRMRSISHSWGERQGALLGMELDVVGGLWWIWGKRRERMSTSRFCLCKSIRARLMWTDEFASVVFQLEEHRHIFPSIYESVWLSIDPSIYLNRFFICFSCTCARTHTTDCIRLEGRKQACA